MVKQSFKTRFSRNAIRQFALQKLKICLLAALFLFQFAVEAQLKPVKRVLILNELGLWSPGIAAIDKQIFVSLENSPYQIEFYSEDLNTSLFPDETSQRELRDWYFLKYRNRKPDLIIAVGPSPLKFLSEWHESFSPGTPVVFWSSTEEFAKPLPLPANFTGVWGVAQPDKTLDLALQLRPGTKHVVVVGGVAPYDRYLEALVRNRFHRYESKLDFTYLTELAMPDLLERLKHLPHQTIVYHTSIMRDAAGAHFIDATQSAPMVANASNAPVFAVDDVDVGRGTVGGYVFSFDLAGQVAGNMALRILNGENPSDIPVVRGASVYLFDWRGLKRFGLKEKDLPPGSVVLNRQPGVWEAYKAYIVGGLSLILLEAALIFGLLWQRKRRRTAERELAITNDRLRLAVEAGSSVAWDWDISKGVDQRFGDLRNIFGIPSDIYSADSGDFRSSVHPEDQEDVWEAVTNARNNRTVFTGAFRVIRRDRAVRWIRARGKFYYAPDGTPERMLGIAIDITDLKQAEHKLHESQERLVGLTGRLIDAQEEERKRIAREIHDDYNQRLALLAIDLEELVENVRDLPAETAQRLHLMWNCVGELGADLHSLSHRLHSSTLESLGLVAGTKAFCQEFAELQDMQINFEHGDIPPHIPSDIALCLFRIVQEGLRNIKRHSGSDKAEVHLEWRGDTIHLSVTDHGKGFDVNKPSPDIGIGIQSMEERLRYFGGQLQIHSRLMEGTRVDASLPLKISERKAG